jgi:hypothetical protein
MPLVAAIFMSIVSAAYQQPTSVTVGVAVLTFAAGLVYEGFAAHHPVAAKLITQIVVGAVAVATIVVGAVLVLGMLVVGIAGAGAGSRTRRRR